MSCGARSPISVGFRISIVAGISAGVIDALGAANEAIFAIASGLTLSKGDEAELIFTSCGIGTTEPLAVAAAAFAETSGALRTVFSVVALSRAAFPNRAERGA